MKLPVACEVSYHEAFISVQESAAIFDWICQHCDMSDPGYVQMADGSQQPMRPWKMMFVDEPLVNTNLFHAVHGRRLAYPPVLTGLRNKIEQRLGIQFSVCVALYYPDGEEYMGFHYDPPAFGPTDIIASMNLGSARAFQLRRKSDHSELHTIELQDGSLVIMGEGCQEEYEHAVPAMAECGPRINLTFRPFNWPEGMGRDNE